MLDAGTASAVTANSSIAGAKGIAWTIVMPSTVSTPQPVAAFTSPCTQRTCTFNGSSSTTPAGTTITNYSWNYGDGTSATGATPAAKTYAANGTYTVVLTVTNSAGATDTETRAITVTATATVPVAAFTSSCVQRTCTFNGSTSTTPAGTTITGYSWNYGDGTSATGATPAVKTYAANGTYNVVLTVTNSAGGTDTETQAVTATAPVGGHTRCHPRSLGPTTRASRPVRSPTSR